MDSTRILKNVAKHISLSSDEMDIFCGMLTHREVSKHTEILKEGNTVRHIFYVHKGALRAYFLGQDGKEFSIMFAVEDWWVTDMFCFLNKRPAMMHIVAMEDSSILQLSRDKFDQLLEELPIFEKYFRILMQNAYTREQVRVIENLSLSAEERYDRFCKRYPGIASKITQRQLASYLGITPEFLSSLLRKKKQSS